MKTGKLIRELRLKKGLTQEELAQMTELSTRTIQRIENGEVDPRAYTLQIIAKALEVDFSMFVDSGTEESKENLEFKNNNFLALLHLSGVLPLFFPTVILWKLKKDKTKDSYNHFRAVIILQLILLCICVVSIWIYWKVNQPIPLFGGLVAGGLLSIINTMRVFNGESYINPLLKMFKKDS